MISFVSIYCVEIKSCSQRFTYTHHGHECRGAVGLNMMHKFEIILDFLLSTQTH